MSTCIVVLLCYVMSDVESEMVWRMIKKRRWDVDWVGDGLCDDRVRDDRFRIGSLFAHNYYQLLPKNSVLWCEKCLHYPRNKNKNQQITSKNGIYSCAHETRVDGNVLVAGENHTSLCDHTKLRYSTFIVSCCTLSPSLRPSNRPFIVSDSYTSCWVQRTTIIHESEKKIWFFSTLLLVSSVADESDRQKRKSCMQCDAMSSLHHSKR